MTLPTQDRVFDALSATWPAASVRETGGFLIREGLGGGKRVSAATATGDTWDIDAAIAAMRALGQTPLFMIREGDDALDADLAVRGFAGADPTQLYAAPAMSLAAEVPRLTVFDIREPLAVMLEIWTEAEIGPARQAVMHRAPDPKTALFGRVGNRPAGVGFVALDGDVAMVHALELRPEARRRGLGRHMMHHAATWAVRHGATHLALAVTRANTGANALYASLGMAVVGGYHYRILPEDPPA
jgi:GNAT superfamily N-acetyltransferase